MSELELELSTRDSGMTSELDQTTRLPDYQTTRMETRRWVPCHAVGGPLTGVKGETWLELNCRLN